MLNIVTLWFQEGKYCPKYQETRIQLIDVKWLQINHGRNNYRSTINQ